MKIFRFLPIDPVQEAHAMIELTRLNGSTILLNSDLIKTCEASPDTMITLLNGEKLIVREDLAQVKLRTMAFRAQLLSAVLAMVRGEIGDEDGPASRVELANSANLAERTTENVLRWGR